MFVAEPAHVLELAIVVHFPRISQRHLVDLCCKLSFFFLGSMSLDILTPTRSESQADMMVGIFPKNYNIGRAITGKVDVVASTTQPKDLLLWYLD